MALATPDDQLRELAQRLETAIGTNSTARTASMSWLMKARENADLAVFLAALTTKEDAGVAVSTRQSAGLMLKDIVRSGHPTLPDSYHVQIRELIPAGLASPISEIQMVCGDVIAAMASRGCVSDFDGLIPFLLDQTAKTNSAGAIGALFKITEDAEKGPAEIDLDSLIRLFSSSNVVVRRHAVATLNSALGKEDVFTMLFAGTRTRATLYETVLDGLVILLPDTDDEIRKQVCQLFTLVFGLSSVVTDKIIAHLHHAVDYVLQSMRASSSDEVRREAAEFWLNAAGSPEFLAGDVAKRPEVAALLESRFDEIVGLLLLGMRYSPDQAAELEASAGREKDDDANKPHFARGRGGQQSNRDDLSDGEIDDDGGLDRLGDEDDSTWTVRKCSAAALDVMATSFPAPVAVRVTSFFQQEFDPGSWVDAEVRVLALGAIADGCREQMLAHIGELAALMKPYIVHAAAPVRQIVCWTLSRYATFFAVTGLDQDDYRSMFGALLDAIVSLLSDRAAMVQAAAASALVTVEQRLGSRLLPYVGPIAHALAPCFGLFRGKAMWLLYDCAQVLCEYHGAALGQAGLIDPIVAALMERVAVVTDEDADVLPLIETLAYIAGALGPRLAGNVDQLWVFALGLLERLLATLGANQGPTTSQGRLGRTGAATRLSADAVVGSTDAFFDRLVVTLDLLAGIVEAVPAVAEERLVRMSPSFFRLVAAALQVPNRDARQSAYALLGDCAIHTFSQVEPVLEVLLDEVVVPQLVADVERLGRDPWLAPVVSNMCWAIGETVTRKTTGLERFMGSISGALVQLLTARSTDSLHENAVIAFGRLGFGYGMTVRPILEAHLETVVWKLVPVLWTDEKASAMQGFCLLLLGYGQPIDHFAVWMFFHELFRMPDEFLSVLSPAGIPIRQTVHDVLFAYRAFPPLTAIFDKFMTESFTAEQIAYLVDKFRLGV